MTKEKAIEMLEKHFGMDFPIFDIIISQNWIDHSNVEVWTFRGLIKIAYDLQDIALEVQEIVVPQPL